jgi:hypothetical protein
MIFDVQHSDSEISATLWTTGIQWFSDASVVGDEFDVFSFTHNWEGFIAATKE